MWRELARKNVLQASDYTIWIMLTISLSANKLRPTFARSVEAAGNNEPPSRTNGLQVRREAQDFRREDVKADALMTFSKQGKDCLSDDGRKSEKNCQP